MFDIKNNVLYIYYGNEKIIKIPDDVICIGPNSFSEKNIEKVILSPNTQTIDYSAFSDCKKLKEIDLKNVEYIYDYAFLNCESLEKIELPKTFVDIGDSFLIKCSSLKEIKFNNKFSIREIQKLIGIDNPNLIEVTGPGIFCENGVVYDENKTALITYLDGKKDEYFKIPDSVKIINAFAFPLTAHLKILELGENVKKINSLGIGANIDKIICNNNLEILNPNSIISKTLKEIDLSKTKIKSFETCFIDCENCNVILPKDIENINYNSSPGFNVSVTIKNAKINDIEPKISGNYKIKNKTLEELIEEGKTFHEANKCINNIFVTNDYCL